MEEGLRNGALKFVLNGRRFNGKWALVRLRAKEGETKENWLLLKEKDEYAKTSEEISKFSTSIRTGRTMTEIAGGPTIGLRKIPSVRSMFSLPNS